MTSFAARYLDGRSSRPRNVLATIDEGQLRVCGEGIDLCYALAEVRISPRLGSTPRSLYLPDGGKCETRDNDALDQASKAVPGSRPGRWLHALESRKTLILCTLVATLAAGCLAIEFGVPLLAKQVAFALPRELDSRLGRGTLEWLDETVLDPSKLDFERRVELHGRFQELARVVLPETPVRLELRSSREVGANAFALPSGIVIATDDLVMLAAHEEEVVAVLAHELGHLHHRHALRAVLQSSIAALLFATVTGDLSSLSALSGALPILMLQLKYSRAFELEADGFALEALGRLGIRRERLADVLESLDMVAGADDLPAYLSTHPASEERIARSRGTP